MNNALRLSFSALLLVGAAACSSPESGGPAAQESNIEGESTPTPTLTLENVYLAHADRATWEPGDPEFRFPVAAEIFYGYRPIKGVTIDVSDNCKDSIEVKAEGTGLDATYTLLCSPNGDKTKTFAFTSGSKTIGQEESDSIRGTSFDFTSNVALRSTGEKSYLLDIEAPSAAKQ